MLLCVLVAKPAECKVLGFWEPPPYTEIKLKLTLNGLLRRNINNLEYLPGNIALLFPLPHIDQLQPDIIFQQDGSHPYWTLVVRHALENTFSGRLMAKEHLSTGFKEIRFFSLCWRNQSSRLWCGSCYTGHGRIQIIHRYPRCHTWPIHCILLNY